MYALLCVSDLSLPDGRLFVAGHTSYQLTRVEASELLVGYPDNFQPADPITRRLSEEVAK